MHSLPTGGPRPGWILNGSSRLTVMSQVPMELKSVKFYRRLIGDAFASKPDTEVLTSRAAG